MSWPVCALVVEREVQRLQVRDEPHPDVGLDAHREPERGVAPATGAHRLHRARREDQEHPLRGRWPSRPSRRPWSIAAPASAGTDDARDGPHEAGEDAEIHHSAVGPHRIAHEPPSGFDFVVCVVRCAHVILVRSPTGEAIKAALTMPSGIWIRRRRAGQNQAVQHGVDVGLAGRRHVRTYDVRHFVHVRRRPGCVAPYSVQAARERAQRAASRSASPESRVVAPYRPSCRSPEVDREVRAVRREDRRRRCAESRSRTLPRWPRRATTAEAASSTSENNSNGECTHQLPGASTTRPIRVAR